MTTPMSQTEHVAKFSQVGKNLDALAQQLIRQHPEFPAASVGQAFIAVGVGAVANAVGPAAATQLLRDLASALDAGTPTAN